MVCSCPRIHAQVTLRADICVGLLPIPAGLLQCYYQQLLQELCGVMQQQQEAAADVGSDDCDAMSEDAAVMSPDGPNTQR